VPWEERVYGPRIGFAARVLKEFAGGEKEPPFGSSELALVGRDRGGRLVSGQAGCDPAWVGRGAREGAPTLRES
jgi:hypothetical protein